MNEYGKRCGLCHKYRESRRFFRSINGKFLLLCKQCWADQKLINGKSINKKIAENIASVQPMANGIGKFLNVYAKGREYRIPENEAEKQSLIKNNWIPVTWEISNVKFNQS